MKRRHAGLVKSEGSGWLLPRFAPPSWDTIVREMWGVTDADDVRWMLERLRPTPVGHFRDPVRRVNAAAEKLPRAYIRCQQYPSARFDMHAEMARRTADGAIGSCRPPITRPSPCPTSSQSSCWSLRPDPRLSVIRLVSVGASTRPACRPCSTSSRSWWFATKRTSCRSTSAIMRHKASPNSASSTTARPMPRPHGFAIVSELPDPLDPRRGPLPSVGDGDRACQGSRPGWRRLDRARSMPTSSGAPGVAAWPRPSRPRRRARSRPSRQLRPGPRQPAIVEKPRCSR